MELLGINLACILLALNEWEFPDKDCSLYLLSKVLGYAVVAGSAVVKLPQIYIIVKNRSVQGLSAMSFETEVAGLTIALAYCLHKKLSFSTYGEVLFLLLQAIVIVALIYNLSEGLGFLTWLKAALYCAIAPTLLAGQLDPLIYESLYASQHAIFLFARIPQMVKNFKSKSTGQLSFLTSFMNFGGSFARLFTLIHEDAPSSMAVGSAIGILVNAVLVIQILLYQKKSKEKKQL